ncbi:MAG: N-acetylglucosamine-6-phosphate deacetylase [Candidatus Solibacter sp.]
MVLQQCSGINALTGLPVQLTFSETIASVSSAGPQDLYLAPGFIDLQVNGFAGVDYNDPHSTYEAIARSLRTQFASGATRIYPTVITGAREEMRACLRNLAEAREAIPHGHAIAGFHVEGPHISLEDGPRGAHPRPHVRPPDVAEFHRLQAAARGLIRIVTLSPEWPEAAHYIERITREGVVASIGHTNASAAQIAAAVAAGATLSTHLGNAAHAVLRRHPNYIWEQLAEDRLTAGFIADGIHLDAAFLKTAIRAKTVDRSLLVTDASTPAGTAPGRYMLGDQPVELTAEGRVVLAGTDRLAGSALHMHKGVGNLMRLAGISLADAVCMATVNPARAGKVEGRESDLVAGATADITQFRVTKANVIEIVATWLAGEKVYAR